MARITTDKVGLDLSARRPALLTAELAKDATWLITMGCGDECPVLPGVRRDDWPLPDPAGQPRGSSPGKVGRGWRRGPDPGVTRGRAPKPGS